MGGRALVVAMLACGCGGSEGSEGDAAATDAAPRESAALDAPLDAPVDSSQADATDDAAADAGTCGNGIAESGELCCTAADRFAFDVNLLGAFIAAVAPPQLCLPREVIINTSLQTVTICSGPCGAGVGCPVDLTYHGLTYNPPTDAFGTLIDVVAHIQVDYSTPVMSGTCTLLGSQNNHTFTATVSIVDTGLELRTSVTAIQSPALSLSWNGCGVIAAVVDMVETQGALIIYNGILEKTRSALASLHASCDY